MFSGAAAIAAVASLLFSVGVMNPFVPMPLHMVNEFSHYIKVIMTLFKYLFSPFPLEDITNGFIEQRLIKNG